MLRYTLVIAIAVLLVAIGHSFILQRGMVGPTAYLTIRGDTAEYVSMIDNGVDAANSPFRHRVLVPLLASLLPLSPADALRLISYGSLAVFYATAMMTASRVGLTLGMSLAGLVVASGSTPHLYNYHNPFLTDAFGLAALGLLLHSLISNSLGLFAGMVIAGVLARETIIFMAPVWVTRRVVPGVMLAGLAAAVLLVVRSLPASRPDTAASLLALLESVGLPRMEAPWLLAEVVYNSWGFIWFIMLAGLCLLPRDAFPAVSGAFVMLFLGASFTCLIALDVHRMFSVLAPVAALTCAQFMHALAGRGFTWAAVFLVSLAVSRAPLLLPNVLVGEDAWLAFSVWRTMFEVVGALFCVWAIYALRQDLRIQGRGHVDDMVGRARRMWPTGRPIGASQPAA